MYISKNITQFPVVAENRIRSKFINKIDWRKIMKFSKAN